MLLGPESGDEVAARLGALRARAAGRVEYLSADFSRLSAVVEAARAVAAAAPIGVLVNDAGIPGSPERRVTDDGHERTLQVNFLALVLLTESLRAAMDPAGRIVNLASATHAMTTLGLDDLELERGYSPCGPTRAANSRSSSTRAGSPATAPEDPSR